MVWNPLCHKYGDGLSYTAIRVQSLYSKGGGAAGDNHGGSLPFHTSFYCHPGITLAHRNGGSTNCHMVAKHYGDEIVIEFLMITELV